MTLADLAYDAFFEEFMGKTGVLVIDEERFVATVMAVMLPADKSRLEPVYVRRAERSAEEPGLIVFPKGTFRGIELRYRLPERHLRLID